MANNYTPAYKNYLSNSAGYVLPSSVRTYSVFDPSSNSWKRMTNDGMSPIQQGGNAQDVQAALRYAQSSQGKVWDSQPAQPAPVPTQIPGILLRPRVQGQPQTPVQMPLGGSRTASPAFGGRGAILVQGQPSRASQRTVEAPAGSQAVPTGNPAMGYAEVRKEYGDPEADIAFLNEQPRGVLTAGKVTTRGVGDVQSPFATPADTGAANVGLPPTNNRVNVADVAFSGLPEGFIKQKQKADTPSFYWDPSERGEMNYNEEMKNLGRAISEDPETAKNVGRVWGSAALAAAPVGAMVGALGKGAVWGARALAGTKTGKNLAQGYRIVRNNAAERGRQIANYLGDRLYNPQSVGTKGFNRFNFENFTDARVSPSVQAQRLADYRQYLQNTARAETPLPPNAIRPLKGFENFRVTGF